MKHKSSRIVALAALYIFIIFGIFVIQFTIGKTFSYTIGAMSVSGRHEVSEDGSAAPLLPLHIVSNGLDFYITEQSPILAETKDGNKIPVKVDAYKKSEDSFTVECSDGISVLFTAYSSGGIDAVKIAAKMPAETANIYFPWKLTQTARLERHDNKIFLRYGKNRYLFKGGYGFENSDEQNSEFPHLVLSSEKPTAFYETYIPAQSLAFESIPDTLLASDNVYSETKTSFRDKALAFLENAVISKNYNEDILTAYIAEMASRGQFQKAKQNAEPLAVPKEKRTYKSCTFYNNLVQTEKSLAVYDREKLKNISSDISLNSASAFKNRALIPYLVNHSKTNLIFALQKNMQNLSEENLNACNAAGILEAAMDYSLFFPNNRNIFYENTELCEKILKDSLFSIDEGLFVSSDEKQIDTERTLEIAAILIRYGKENPEKKAWKFVGQMLYSSILSYAGESASLPAYFDIQGSKTTKLGLMANDSVILYADKLYPLAVTDNPAFPHEESLGLQSEHGIWAWTSSNSITVTQNNAKVFAFRIGFKTEDMHYLIIRGIRPFYRIQIHGINFRSDQRFEIYNSSGYVYDERTGTLLLKLKHKKDFEDIILSLGRPPEPAPIPVPPAAAQEETPPAGTENTQGGTEESSKEGGENNGTPPGGEN
ncbi:hypothetical protein [Treponema pedis]|uniref:hypothetical protein n=1 Tax=Treponema pedis TaxID=409322 RepID=UPI000466CF63|nr:hypothetical protein [Treponema pedis]QSI03891.1 hypothetical protein DYQ05_02605 [Treponema pedis]